MVAARPFSFIALIVLILLGRPAPGAANFRRAWVVDWQGTKSILLGTDHQLEFDEKDMPAGLRTALKNSTTVFLESHPLPQLGEPFPELTWEERRLSGGFHLLPHLSVDAIRALKKLFPAQDDFKQWTSVQPGTTFLMAEQQLEIQMDEIKRYFGHNLDLMMERKLDPGTIDENFIAYGMDPVLEFYAKEFYDSSEPLVITYRILREQSEKIQNSEFRGVDYLIEQWAKAEEKPVQALDALESFERGERKFLALVDTKSLDKALTEMRVRLNQRLGMVYYFDSIIRSTIFRVWTSKNYFSDLSAEQYSETAHRLSANQPHLIANIPSIEAVNRYEHSRHRYWFPHLSKAAKQAPVFIAAGLDHIVDRGPTSEPTLLDLFRAEGFQVSEWDNPQNCESLLH